MYLAVLILSAVADINVCGDRSEDVPTLTVRVVPVVEAITTGFLYAGCCLSPCIAFGRADTKVCTPPPFATEPTLAVIVVESTEVNLIFFFQKGWCASGVGWIVALPSIAQVNTILSGAISISSPAFSL